MAHQHPHPHPHPGGPGAPPTQMLAPPQLPPQSAALLDSLPFTPISFLLKEAAARPGAPPPLPVILSAENEQVVDEKAGVDFRDLNQLNFWMSWLNESHAPPPPNVSLQANHAGMVNKTKEEGNTHFKSKRYREAGAVYSRALGMSMSRPPWEQAKPISDEVTACLLNRSAAAAGLEEWPAAYADADACIKISPKNSRGYLRLAKALVGMQSLEEAYSTISRGLVVDAESTELKTYALEVLNLIQAKNAAVSAKSAVMASGEKVGEKEEGKVAA